MSATQKTKRDNLKSDEHIHWKAHRRLILGVAREAVGFRGAAALGMMMENSGNWTSGPPQADGEATTLVPDADISWLALQDLPASRWSTSLSRETHLATVRKTSQQFGMPRLRWGELQAAFDFRLLPVPSSTQRHALVQPGRECLNSKCVQVFRAFNALNWALTSTAVHYRHAWKDSKKEFYDLIGLPYSKEATSLLFGEGVYNGAEQPHHWAPRPVLGFHERTRKHLFDYSTRNPNGSVTFTDDLQWAFIHTVEAGMPIIAHHNGKVIDVVRGQEWHDMSVVHLIVQYAESENDEVVGEDEEGKPIIAKKPIKYGKPVTIIARPDVLLEKTGKFKFKQGQVLGFDGPRLPSHWRTLPASKKWTGLQQVFKTAFNGVLHLWFDRQIMHLVDGYVHVPASLAAKAAMGAAVESMLYWDVTRAMPYYNPACDALIFPTLRMSYWDGFRLNVGELDVDLTPFDPRYRPERVKEWQPLDRPQQVLKKQLRQRETASAKPRVAAKVAS